MNVDELGPWLAQHKTAALGAGAGGVVLLALYKRKKAGGTDTSAAATASSQGITTAAGAYSSGAQLAAGGYDSTANDVYDAIQPQIEQLQNRLSSIPVAQAPATSVATPTGPLANSLFAPANTGRYVQFGNGLIAEVEKDGSLLGLTSSEWANVRQKLGKNYTVDKLSAQTSAGFGGTNVAANLQRTAQQQKGRLLTAPSPTAATSTSPAPMLTTPKLTAPNPAA